MGLQATRFIDRFDRRSLLLFTYAVNAAGIVGLAWLDTRRHPGVRGYDLHVAASRDRGETFTALVRVNTASSRPRMDHRRDPKNHATHRWLPGFDARRWANGGDHLGMVALADGAFLPVWPDACHEGIQQLYYACIRVRPAAASKWKPFATACADGKTQPPLGGPRDDGFVQVMGS